jgi:DNA-binding CsgD family transcriptional regulator
MKDLDIESIEEIKSGYSHTPEDGKYTCFECGAEFREGEIYAFDGRFFDARRAVSEHIAREHGERFYNLLESGSRYVSLTDNQKQLLDMIHQGIPDAKIAEKLGVSASTVRHQKFVFREKASKARMYLALCELAFDRPRAEEGSAKAPLDDGRFNATKTEAEKILKNAFSSLSPLKLKLFPVKEKKKIVILAKIAEQFEKGKTYTEKEVNEILGSIFDDYVTLRRYLIEYSHMDRTRDCKSYWML